MCLRRRGLGLIRRFVGAPHKGKRPLQLLPRRFPRKDLTVHVLHAVVVVRGRGQKPFGGGIRLPSRKRAVQEEESLGRDGRNVARAVRFTGLGEVERLEEPAELSPYDGNVDASVVLLHVPGLQLLVPRSHLSVSFPPLNRRPARRLELQFPADEQHRVPNGLDFQPSPIHAPQQLVVGIVLEVRAVKPGRKLIAAAEHDFPNDALHRPALVHELDRQIVQQSRMRGLFAHLSEIVDAADQAAAEQVVPDAVHHHSRRKRVVPPDQPLRQLPAAAFAVADVRPAGSLSIKHLQEPARHLFPESVGVSSDVDAARLYGVTVLDAHRHVPRQRQLVEFLRQVPNLLPVLGFDGLLDLPPQLVPPELCPAGPRFRGARRSIQPHELVDLEVAGAVLGTLAQSALEFRAAKDPGQRVVVTRRNRIELVIVTTGASDGQPENGARCHVDHLVGHVHRIQHPVRLVEIVGAQSEKPRRGHLLAPLPVGFGGQQIAGDLLADEPIVGLIAVEGVDDVIAVAPGHRKGIVQRSAHGFAIAGDIEPMASPTFAEPRRPQQTVDYLAEGMLIRVIDKGVDFFRRRRQAEQIERGAAKKGRTVSVGDGRQAGLLALRQEELIHCASRPGKIVHGREFRPLGGLESPVPPPLLQVDLGFLFDDCLFSRIRGSSLDPLPEVRDHLRGQLARRRHLQFGFVTQRLEQQAVGGTARYDRLSPVAAA